MNDRPLTTLEEIEEVCASSPLSVRERIPHNMLRAMTAQGCTLIGTFDGETLVGATLTWYGLDAANNRVEHSTTLL